MGAGELCADIGGVFGEGELMILRLPFPDSKLFPNAKNGKSWKVSHAAKVSAREYAYTAAKQAQAGFSDKGGAIPLSIVFCQPDNRKRDLDNMLAAMKSALDGVAEALGVDDKRFRPITIDAGPVDKAGSVLVAVGVEILGDV